LVQTEVTAVAAAASASSKKMRSPPKKMRGRQTPHNIIAAETTILEQFAQERTLQLLCLIAQSLARIESQLRTLQLSPVQLEFFPRRTSTHNHK
jgi:hypothetical protein